MNWSLVGRSFRLCFLLRVPLLTLLVLAALGPVSQLTSASALLGNLFDAQNDSGAVWYNVFALSFAAFLLAFTAITTLNLTLHYGTLRFSDEPVAADGADATPRFEMAQRRPGLTFIIGTLAGCILVATVIARTGVDKVWLSTSAALLAFSAALLMALLAKIVQLALTDSSVTSHPPPFLVFPAYRWAWLEKQFDALYCWPPPDSKSPPAIFVRHIKFGFSSLSQWPYQIFEGASQGYLMFISSPEGGRLKLRSGHVFALTLALLAFIAYVIVGFDKAAISAAPAAVPALAYVLLFLIVACWCLSALTFFCDRFRFPLLMSILVLASLTVSVPQSDHFFRVETSDSVKKLAAVNVEDYLTPAHYLAERANDSKHRRLIVVATPGGGIQAAAWTAKVLQELDTRFQDINGANGFRQSVALISSVSGGSLGSMIYAASFAGNVDRSCTAENAQASGIDEVAWGWTSPDFWRAVFPLFRPHPEIDRGWALEQKWAVINGLSPEPACFSCRVRPKPRCVGQNSGTSPDPASNDTYLSDWAMRGTKLPALIFNSMLVERGEHVVFSTNRFPFKNDPRGITNFYDLYPHVGKPFDVRVNTAARLSASFPYVAPASRPNLNTPYVGDFHFVDGGYYDNLGIDALIGWLSSAYQQDPALIKEIPEVLVLQIRHFNPDILAQASKDGWGFQLFAPITALLRMWNNAPVHRDQNELNLFIQNSALSKHGPIIRTVMIPYCGLNYSGNADTSKAFDACIAASGGQALSPARLALEKTKPLTQSKQNHIDCADQPLSWKLTQNQKQCINDTWEDFAHDDPNGALWSVGQFLTGAPVAAQKTQ